MRRGLIPFFVLTLAVTETCFVTVLRMPAGAPLRTPVLYLGIFAPALVALGVTRLLEGGDGVRALLSRLARGPVAARWWIFAVVFTPALKLLGAVEARLMTGAWPRIDLSHAALIPFAIAISTPVQIGEELGWRGFALPRMAERMGLATASLVLGGLWALWHLPLFWLTGGDSFGQSFPVYTLSVVGLSAVVAWLFAEARGNLLVVMLFHATVDNATGIVPTATAGAHDPWRIAATPVAWCTLATLGACAVAIGVAMARHDRELRSRIAASD